jgi:hypothetical protein
VAIAGQVNYLVTGRTPESPLDRSLPVGAPEAIMLTWSRMPRRRPRPDDDPGAADPGPRRRARPAPRRRALIDGYLVPPPAREAAVLGLLLAHPGQIVLPPRSGSRRRTQQPHRSPRPRPADAPPTPPHLAAREAAILGVLMAHAGEIVHRAALADAAGYLDQADYCDLDRLACRLRRRLQNSPCHPSGCTTSTTPVTSSARQPRRAAADK